MLDFSEKQPAFDEHAACHCRGRDQQDEQRGPASSEGEKQQETPRRHGEQQGNREPSFSASQRVCERHENRSRAYRHRHALRRLAMQARAWEMHRLARYAFADLATVDTVDPSQVWVGHDGSILDSGMNGSRM